jgi:hypothetical protein
MTEKGRGHGVIIIPSTNLPEWIEENHESTPFRLAYVPAEIRTRHGFKALPILQP